jgi:adenylate cyclase
VQTVPRRGYRLLVEPVTGDAGLTAMSPITGEEPAIAGPPKTPRLWTEMLRHGVVQAGLAYLVFGWLLIQVGDATFDNLGLPSVSGKFVTFVVVGGFPLVVLLSWFLEMAGGRMVRDRGEQPVGWLKGLERNYLAIVAAYALAVLGAGFYHLTVGFEVDEPTRTGLFIESAEAGYIPVEPNSVAVLHFQGLDDDPRTHAMSAGLSEDILDRLARVPGLRVASRGDAWSLPENAPSELVRRRLRVAWFVEGSVRVAGNEIRVVAQLIDSESERHVVSRQFERRIENHLDVQKEITDLVVANLRVALPAEDPDVPLLGIESVDVNLYVLYRQGMESLYLPPTDDSIDQAARLFQDALALDPEFAVAHAGLCTAYLGRYGLQHDATVIDDARDACAAAVATGGQLPAVYVAVGRLNAAQGEYDKAESAYKAALQIDARHVPAWQGLAFVREQLNDTDAAESMLRKAIDLQPGNWQTYNSLANMQFNAGQFRQAADEYQHAVYLNPDNFVLQSNLGGALILAGDLDAAVRVYETSLQLEQNEEAYSNLAIVYYLRGDYTRSAELHRKAVVASPGSSASWANLADTLYFAGDTAAANDAYERALELAGEDLKVNARDVIAICVRAWALAMLGHAEEARDTIAHVLRLAPRNPYSHYYDALIKARQGDIEGAVLAAGAAMELGYPRSMLELEPHLAALRRTHEFVEAVNGESD